MESYAGAILHTRVTHLACFARRSVAVAVSFRRYNCFLSLGDAPNFDFVGMFFSLG